MEQRLNGKMAIVTGSGQGIGKAVALRLAHEGADVVVADINLEKAQQTAQEIRALRRRAMTYGVDVASVAEIRRMVDSVAAEFGRIDILVNCAGVVQAKPFLEITEDDWDRIIDINLKGTTFCIQAVAAQMVRQAPEQVKMAGRADRSYGKIVNFSSISGRHGRALQLHYAASKTAVISVTQSAALALAPYNINVNAVAPGVIPTAMWEQIDRECGHIFGAQPGEAIGEFIEKIPLKRAGSPEDVAGAVAFLCSADADYITGQTLNVDGGYEMS
ncbi:MAG: glucose 1-dehydrogenase [Sedimentisphaerales bacterium]|nr:glucose 1-dehydrogenase [Sedimentisphaerales bacterium]